MTTKKNLIHLATEIFDTPLMIQPGKLDIILSVLAPRFEVEVPTAAEAVEVAAGPVPLPGAPQRMEPDMEGTIAVLPVTGTLMHRTHGLEAMSGLLSYAMIGERFEKLMENPSVKAIVFDFDSPGGQVAGAFDLAAQIFEARGKKPLYAIVNEKSFSAAYLLASACEKIYIPRTGNVGSIGVVATHIDRSQKDEKEGLKVTHIYAGERKVDLSPHAPLSERARADVQEHVDESYKLFTSTVAKYRGMTVKAVVDTRAAMFLGKSAVKAGLADAVMSTTEAMSLIIREVSTMTTEKKTAGVAAASPGQIKSGPDEEEVKALAPVAEFPPKKDDAPKDKKKGDEEEEEEVDEEAKKDKTKKAAIAPASAPAAAVDVTVAANSRAAAIVEMCAAVGKADLASDLIRSGVSVEACKARLFDNMAAAGETIINATHPTAGSEADQGVNLMRAAAQTVSGAK